MFLLQTSRLLIFNKKLGIPKTIWALDIYQCYLLKVIQKKLRSVFIYEDNIFFKFIFNEHICKRLQLTVTISFCTFIYYYVNRSTNYMCNDTTWSVYNNLKRRECKSTVFLIAMILINLHRNVYQPKHWCSIYMLLEFGHHCALVDARPISRPYRNRFPLKITNT